MKFNTIEKLKIHFDMIYSDEEGEDQKNRYCMKKKVSTKDD